jgi:hypothetical protein
VIPLTLLLLVLHVTEIAGRRLLLFSAVGEWVRSLRLPRLRRPRRRPVATPSAQADPGLPRQSPKGEGGPTVSALERAKRKARNRMGG